MAKTLLQLFFAALLLVVHSQSAQAQNGTGYRYYPYPFALLRALAVQAGGYNQRYVTRSSCHPTRVGYYGGYRPRYRGNSRARRGAENELAHARLFYEKRRIRQQYLDEQRLKDESRLAPLELLAHTERFVGHAARVPK